MSIPRFTAEESLYASKAQYNMTAAGLPTANANIQPQLPITCGYLSQAIRFKYLKFGEAVSANNWTKAEEIGMEIHVLQEAYSACAR